MKEKDDTRTRITSSQQVGRRSENKYFMTILFTDQKRKGTFRMSESHDKNLFSLGQGVNSFGSRTGDFAIILDGHLGECFDPVDMAIG